MSTDAVGKIEEVFHSDRKAEFELIVSDFFGLSVGGSLSTSTFTCFGMEMDIQISTALDSTMCALRIFDTGEGGASILATIGLKTSGYREEDEVLFRDCRFTKKNRIWFLIEFLDLSVLDRVRRCLLFRGKVSITLRRESPPPEDERTISRETQTENTPDSGDGIDLPNELDMEGVSALLKNFKDLLLTGDDHDVIIKVKNKEFKAHKCVLRARSPVFEAMFRSRMKESADGTVSIDDCDPEVFGLFLRYVYTAELDIHSVSQAVGLYYAGDKYDLPLLKKKVIAFLMISFSTTTITDVFTLAATHSEEELMQKAFVYFLKNVEEIMLTVEWQRFLSSNPIQANQLNLRAVQCLKASCTNEVFLGIPGSV